MSVWYTVTSQYVLGLRQNQSMVLTQCLRLLYTDTVTWTMEIGCHERGIWCLHWSQLLILGRLVLALCFIPHNLDMAHSLHSVLLENLQIMFGWKLVRENLKVDNAVAYQTQITSRTILVARYLCAPRGEIRNLASYRAEIQCASPKRVHSLDYTVATLIFKLYVMAQRSCRQYLKI